MSDSNPSLEAFVARLDERLTAFSSTLGEVKDEVKAQGEKLDAIKANTGAMRGEIRDQQQAHENLDQRLTDLASKVSDLDQMEQSRALLEAENRGARRLVTAGIGLASGGGGTAITLIIVLIIAQYSPDLLPGLLRLLGGSP